MQKDKIETIIGFAVKAGKMSFGADNLGVSARKIRLIFMSESVSEKTAKRVKELSVTCKIPLIFTKKDFSEIVFKQNCKVAGLTDNQMSKYILNNINENYQLYVAEEK